MIRVAVVDDHAVVRAGVRALLATQPDLCLVAEAANGHGAVDLLRHHALDVMLLDLGMADGNGLDTLVSLKARRPALPVVFFSGYDEVRYGPVLIRQGASGYVSKESDPSEVCTAIRTVAGGRRYISPSLASALADELSRGAAVAPHETLSERELQVFIHLAEGGTVGEVARAMCLSVKTVSTYRSRVLQKLQRRSNSDLTYYALQHGLIR